MVRLERVTKIFRVGEHEVRALHDVDLEIGAGEYISLMGPSGSGKSTLLNVIGLLDRPTSGRYLLGGQDTTDLSDLEQARLRRERIGFVFQFFHLIPRMTARENVELPLVLAGVSPAERVERVDVALRSVDLTDRADHRPGQLSGGQRQRVAIARATMLEPSVLLADEPTGNLDQRSGRDVLELLESFNRKGLTVLVVTHDPEIGRRASRRIRMVDGEIVASETATAADR